MNKTTKLDPCLSFRFNLPLAEPLEPPTFSRPQLALEVKG